MQLSPILTVDVRSGGDGDADGAKKTLCPTLKGSCGGSADGARKTQLVVAAQIHSPPLTPGLYDAVTPFYSPNQRAPIFPDPPESRDGGGGSADGVKKTTVRVVAQVHRETDMTVLPSPPKPTVEKATEVTETIVPPSSPPTTGEKATEVTEMIVPPSSPPTSVEKATEVTETIVPPSSPPTTVPPSSPPTTVEKATEVTETIVPPSSPPTTVEKATKATETIVPPSSPPTTVEKATEVTETIVPPSSPPTTVEKATEVTETIVPPSSPPTTVEKATEVTETIVPAANEGEEGKEGPESDDSQTTTVTLSPDTQSMLPPYFFPPVPERFSKRRRAFRLPNSLKPPSASLPPPVHEIVTRSRSNLLSPAVWTDSHSSAPPPPPPDLKRLHPDKKMTYCQTVYFAKKE